MKRQYVSPSFEKIDFLLPNLLLENSDIFDDKDNSADGDVTVIKPFG